METHCEPLRIVQWKPSLPFWALISPLAARPPGHSHTGDLFSLGFNKVSHSRLFLAGNVLHGKFWCIFLLQIKISSKSAKSNKNVMTKVFQKIHFRKICPITSSLCKYGKLAFEKYTLGKYTFRIYPFRKYTFKNTSYNALLCNPQEEDFWS